MKRVFMLLAVALFVFCFGSAAMAEGFTVSGDLTWTEPNTPDPSDPYNVAVLAVDGQYDLDPFVVGGEVIFGVYRDPAYEAPETAFAYTLGLYGGYKLLGDDALNLTAVLGYYMFNQTYTAPDGTTKLEWNASSIMAGIKAAANFEPVSVSLTYLYGVSPAATLDMTGIPVTQESDEPGYTILELKGVYALNESWGISLVYRNSSVVGITFDGGFADGVDLGNTGFGVGLTYTF